MKKFMKGCAITALIFLVVGTVLSVVSVAVKGTVGIGEIVEAVTGGKLHFDLTPDDGDWGFFLGEALNDAGYYDIDEESIFEAGRPVAEGDVEKYMLEEGIRSLELEAGGCTVEVLYSEDDSFYVEARNMGKFQCYVEGGTLYLRALDVRELSELDEEFKKHQVFLYVPHEFFFESVEAEVGAGFLELPRITAEEISLTVGAGLIRAEYLETNCCEVEVGMGEIVVDNMMTGELEAGIGMGHLAVYGSVQNNLSAECSMGAVELKLTGRETDFNYNLEAGMGNISVAGEDYGGLAQNKRFDHAANKTMDLECAMGAIEVFFTE